MIPLRAINGWAMLRDYPEITFGLVDLPAECGGATYARYTDGSAVILIDRKLSRVERHAKLVHELAHHWYGVGGPVEADERKIDRIVAAWLVPWEDLAQLVASVCRDGSPIEAWQIAEAFDVPDAVAVRACELLREVVRQVS